MSENIDPTWIAYALDEPRPGSVLEVGLTRVETHYAELVDYPLARNAALGACRGVAVIGDAEPRCAWPHFAERGGYAIATAYPSTGWAGTDGYGPLEEAPLRLADRVARDPAGVVASMNAPGVVAVLEEDGRRLTIVNDLIGAGRLYELRFAGGRVWSNRAGALSLFTGIAPRPDPADWLVLAAASWFLAESTPFADVRKIGPGTVILADDDGVGERPTNAVGGLVGARQGGLARLLGVGRGRDLGPLADTCAADARAQALAAAALWPGTADVDLSGGRDSRLVAAAAVAAGIDARFLTSDATPGEADVARQLIAVVPGEPEHKIRKGGEGSATPSTPLPERARNLHLLHDGLRHPQKLRGKMTLPRSRPTNATMSGHGGEIAHGFFYKNARQVRKLKRGGQRRLVRRALRFFTKDHEAARPQAYERARAVIEATFEEGREQGLEGPSLLDWFYLLDRFTHRSGLASHSERISAFATPGFIAAAFALTPEQRVQAALHREVIARLVPAWRDLPFFQAQSSRMPKIRRQRLWEIPDDAAEVERILEGGGSWTEIYHPDRVHEAWDEVRAGGGSSKWEQIFEGVAYRHYFDDHLTLLAERAAVGPSLAGEPG